MKVDPHSVRCSLRRIKCSDEMSEQQSVSSASAFFQHVFVFIKSDSCVMKGRSRPSRLDLDGGMLAVASLALAGRPTFCKSYEEARHLQRVFSQQLLSAAITVPLW